MSPHLVTNVTRCVPKILSTVCADMVAKIDTKLFITFITKFGEKVVAKFVIVIVIVIVRMLIPPSCF